VRSSTPTDGQGAKPLELTMLLTVVALREELILVCGTVETLCKFELTYITGKILVDRRSQENPSAVCSWQQLYGGGGTAPYRARNGSCDRTRPYKMYSRRNRGYKEKRVVKREKERSKDADRRCLSAVIYVDPSPRSKSQKIVRIPPKGTVDVGVQEIKEPPELPILVTEKTDGTMTPENTPSLSA